MNNELNKTNGLNSAKKYQLILFPFNNGATNVYFILTSTYIAYFANGVLGLALLFATTMVTVMRVFDGITDPIIGMLIDKTQGRFGKFRPYIILGNLIMAAASLLLYFAVRFIPSDYMGLRYTAYIILYAVYVIGYTFQTSCTRSGLTCLTNDPKQRPLFTVFNTIASLVGMGLIQCVAALVGGKYGYGSIKFFNIVVPLSIVLSLVLTILAMIGIWEKDRPEFYGVCHKQEKIQVKQLFDILKNNKELRMLIIAGAGTKLAFSIATNTTITCMLYAAMMGNYNGLYLPMYIIGYIASAPFFLLSVKTAQKKGQKAALVNFTALALAFYTLLLGLLLFWQNGNPATILSLTNINVYTVLFVLFYAIGYGAYYCTADMSIPMIADCSDYETYRTGKYIPGIIATLFALVDKLISSLGATVVGLSVILIGLKELPDTNTTYLPGMKGLVIVLFCFIPILSWIITLIAMHHYSLGGKEMEEIQAVNASRKAAITEGMQLNEAMKKWKIAGDDN